MKILWFSHIPIEIGASAYMGGNWITALKEALLLHSDIELAVCFHSHQPSEWKTVSNGLTVYNLYNKKNKLNRLLQKHLHLLTDNDTERYLDVVQDFKPDIIQVFGTESSFGMITSRTSIPVVIHVQGILESCLENWFPKGFNLRDTRKYVSIRSLLLGNGNYHRYFILQKQAVREREIIRLNRHFFTRTHWDKKLIGELNPKAQLLHCDEMLRPLFYTGEWSPKHHTEERIRFVSVMNGEIYKGLDNILQIADRLRTRGLAFEWHVIGIAVNDPILTLFEVKTSLSFTACNIHFDGKMSETKLVDALLSSDLFLHVAHIDNSPNSVCEAMLLGMPVVCNDVGGCASLITDGLNGILLPDYAPDTWAGKLAELTVNKSLLQSLGQAARKTALERHDPSKITQSVIRHWYDVIHNYKQTSV